MSQLYRERREAGLYDADEKTRDKARVDLDKQANERLKQSEKEAQGTEGTANPQ